MSADISRPTSHKDKFFHQVENQTMLLNKFPRSWIELEWIANRVVDICPACALPPYAGSAYDKNKSELKAQINIRLSSVTYGAMHDGVTYGVM